MRKPSDIQADMNANEAKADELCNAGAPFSDIKKLDKAFDNLDIEYSAVVVRWLEISKQLTEDQFASCEINAADTIVENGYSEIDDVYWMIQTAAEFI